MMCTRRSCPNCKSKMDLILHNYSKARSYGKIVWYCNDCKKEYCYVKTEYTNGRYTFAGAREIEF